MSPGNRAECLSHVYLQPFKANGRQQAAWTSTGLAVVPASKRRGAAEEHSSGSRVVDTCFGPGQQCAVLSTRGSRPLSAGGASQLAVAQAALGSLPVQGRGFRDAVSLEDRLQGGQFEALPTDKGPGPAKCEPRHTQNRLPLPPLLRLA